MNTSVRQFLLDGQFGGSGNSLVVINKKLSHWERFYVNARIEGEHWNRNSECSFVCCIRTLNFPGRSQASKSANLLVIGSLIQDKLTFFVVNIKH